MEVVIKRPLLVTIIGFILGIIYGLCFKKSIALIICISWFMKRAFNKIIPKKFKRYGKVLLSKKITFLFMISAIISNTYCMYLNNEYKKIYELDGTELNFTGTVVEGPNETEYVNLYIIKMDSRKYKNKKFIIYLNKNVKIKYGDCVEIEGELTIPDGQRNYKGYNYRQYLQSKKVYGIINVKKYKTISRSNLNFLLMASNSVKDKIISNSKELFNEESAVVNGIILGNKSQIDDNIIEVFKQSSLSHILAVSGMHVNYIVLGITLVLKSIRTNKKSIYVSTIICLIVFIFITGFNLSVLRACIMGILVIFSKIVHRKTDVPTTIGISLLLILLENPYAITNVGLQLSYFGTIGIIILYRKILNYFQKKFIINKSNIYTKKRILKEKILEMISVALSAQLFLIPLLILYFNTVSLSFIISNIIAIPIVVMILIGAYILIIISFININIASVFSFFIQMLVRILIIISTLISQIPLTNFSIVTPSKILIYIYYAILLAICFLSNSRILKKDTVLMKGLIILKKYAMKILIIFIILLVFFSTVKKITKDSLEIYFIDVGQRR